MNHHRHWCEGFAQLTPEDQPTASGEAASALSLRRSSIDAWFVWNKRHRGPATISYGGEDRW
jgi:hypothetical protein